MSVPQAERLLTKTTFFGFAAWDIDFEACASATILLEPDAVSIFRRVFYNAGTAGRILALRGLYLLSFGDFVELLTAFEPEEPLVTLAMGCVIRPATPYEALIELLSREPSSLAGLARQLSREVTAQANSALQLTAPGATLPGTAAER